MSYCTWITEDIAIGELNASYEAFDTIVNNHTVISISDWLFLRFLTLKILWIFY